TATAELIRAMHAGEDAGLRRARWLVVGLAVAAAATWLRDGRPAWIPAVTLLAAAPAASFAPAIAWSPLLAGTGFLVGLGIAISRVAGGLLAWCLLAPRMLLAGAIAGDSYEAQISWLLWPGVSMMVVASLADLAFEWRTVRRGLAD